MKKQPKFSKSNSMTNLNENKHKKILDKEDLIMYIYKLKISLNKLIVIKEGNLGSINYLKKQENKLACAINDKLDDNANELMPVVDDNFSLFSQEDKMMLKKKIDHLNKIKNEYNNKQDIDIEYRSSLLAMIQNEKENIKKINDRMLEAKERLANIKLSSVNITHNEIEYKKKIINIERMTKNLKSEGERMSSLIDMQSHHISDLSNSIEKKKRTMVKAKDNLTEKTKNLERDTKLKKEDIKNKILNVEREKNNKSSQENHFIKLIVGLDLIENFLMKSFELDPKEATRRLYESEEYKIFRSERYVMADENSLSPSKSSKNVGLSNLGLNNLEEVKARVNLSDLKKKFENLTIGYKDIIFLYSKILHKKNFNHSIMIKYNLKQIQLEEIRENSSRRIQSLISKHYKNLDDFIKSNSKVEALMTKYKYMNYSYQKPAKIYVYEGGEVDNNDFFDKCSRLIYIVKSFLENLMQNLDPEGTKEYSDDIQEQSIDMIKRIKDYFKVITQLDSISKDDFIRGLFHDCEGYLNIRSKTNSISTIDHNELKEFNQNTLEENYLKLKSFFLKERNNFNLIKVDIQKSIYYNFTQVDLIITIVDALLKLLKVINPSRKKMSSKVGLNDDSLSVMSGGSSMRNLFKSKKSVIFKPKNNSDIDLEDNIQSEDENQVVKKKVEKVRTNKLNTFLKKMYEPYMESKSFLRSLNENVSTIKRNTRSNIVDNFKLQKKQHDIDRLSNELILYNNPKINLNRLSNNTYNSFVKYIISSQLELSKNKSVEDLTLRGKLNKKH